MMYPSERVCAEVEGVEGALSVCSLHLHQQRISGEQKPSSHLHQNGRPFKEDFMRCLTQAAVFVFVNK